MIYAALLILGAGLLFLSIAFVAVLFCIVLPMREELEKAKAKQNEHGDTIERNANATIGLYMVHNREIAALQRQCAFVEAYVVPVLPGIEEAPITQPSPKLGVSS